MKTRFSALVSVKKNRVQKSEIDFQTTMKNLQSAENALKDSYDELENITTPNHGSMALYRASQELFQAQRDVIEQKQEWKDFAQKELEKAQERLKQDMIEYEKFKYLESKEIEKILKKIEQKEAKDLDEIALMTFTSKE